MSGLWTTLWWLNQLAAWVAILGLLMTVANFGYVTACYYLFRPRGTTPAPLLDDAFLPHVLLQIPMFNEPNVVEQAAQGAVALDWPRDKLHIQILDDSTDNTPEIAAAVVASCPTRLTPPAPVNPPPSWEISGSTFMSPSTVPVTMAVAFGPTLTPPEVNTCPFSTVRVTLSLGSAESVRAAFVVVFSGTIRCTRAPTTWTAKLPIPPRNPEKL